MITISLAWWLWLLITMAIFTLGALVFRNNAKAANAKISQLQDQKDSMVAKATTAETKLQKITEAAEKDFDAVKTELKKL